MRYRVLATDYDNTLATDGRVPATVVSALEKLRASGRDIVLVTGRELDDLLAIFPQASELFARIVAENGGVIYQPDTNERRLLAGAPPDAFVAAMRERGVPHLGVSETLVATVRPYERIALEAIRDLGLDLHVVFNGDAVMIVAPGVSKASGLVAALDELGLSPHSAVGVGDGENDHPLVDVCECGVAVANSVPSLREHADIVTEGVAGAGVIELIDELVDNDLANRAVRRRELLLGTDEDSGDEVTVAPYGTVMLVTGPSSSGKSKMTRGFLERLAAAQYQFCVIDPEGDHEGTAGTVSLGDASAPPAVDDVAGLLRSSRQNVVANLMRVPAADRPHFCAELLPSLQKLRAQTGRPHWLIVDEAHHLFPAQWEAAASVLPAYFDTALIVSTHPDLLAPALLAQTNAVLAAGDDACAALEAFAAQRDLREPQCDRATKLEHGQMLLWQPDAASPGPRRIKPAKGHGEHRRHVRKYAEGLLIPERSFYFRGPEQKLNLRAHNLTLFIELAQGVDDGTWRFHLQQGDYSRWFADVIGDDDLADAAREIEAHPDAPASETRTQLCDAIAQRYTQPENPTLPSPTKTSAQR
jgi:HAD superfamily hydrolase (TIGR01484 family)